MASLTTSDLIFFSVEGLLVLIGLALAVRQRRYDDARDLNTSNAPLGVWEIRPEVFAFAAIRVLLGAVLVWFSAGALLRYFAPTLPMDRGIGLLIVGGSFHVGLLLGLGIAKAFLRQSPWDLIASAPPARLPLLPAKDIPREGLFTFLVVLAAVVPITLAWQWILGEFGAVNTEQEMIDFLRSSTSWVDHAVIIFVATVLAPIGEELAFRGGLFRYLRVRTPVWVAYCAPSFFFALIHFNVQALPGLFVLAVLFNRAYERTGRITVPIIAHSLFNLHTIVQVIIQASLPPS